MTKFPINTVYSDLLSKVHFQKKFFITQIKKVKNIKAKNTLLPLATKKIIITVII